MGSPASRTLSVQRMSDHARVGNGRDRLVVALDVASLLEARALAARLVPYAATMKIGLELYLAEGPRAVGEIAELGCEVFLDLKLHDIPTTVRRAAAVVGSLGARYLTLHTAGGAEMMRAGVEGLAQGAARAGRVAPVAVGVTVLTSESVAAPQQLIARLAVASEAGCGAYVCAGQDLSLARAHAPGLVAIVPGIRLAGAPVDDQKRAMDPGEAVRAGADLVVVGRPITRAGDPEAVAAAIGRSLVDGAQT